MLTPDDLPFNQPGRRRRPGYIGKRTKHPAERRRMPPADRNRRRREWMTVQRDHARMFDAEFQQGPTGSDWPAHLPDGTRWRGESKKRGATFAKGIRAMMTDRDVLLVHREGTRPHEDLAILRATTLAHLWALAKAAAK